MASVVLQMGRGGQRQASLELGWNRGVIRKGLHESQSGITCVDAFSALGRKRWEDHLPCLENDIREIADSNSQTDPPFRTTLLYRRITGAEVRRQLLEIKGYPLNQVPSLAQQSYNQKEFNHKEHEEKLTKKEVGRLGFTPVQPNLPN